MYIPLDSVATQLTCREIFNNYFLLQIVHSVPVKKVKKWLKFSENMDNGKV